MKVNQPAGENQLSFAPEGSESGWNTLLSEYPWFRCNGCYNIRAYSEFMPAPRFGRQPYGRQDPFLADESDPFGWKITEMEEEYELRPGIEQIGRQIMTRIFKFGSGEKEHFIGGHGGENLKDNPYWPKDLALNAGKLSNERFVTLLPLMLSRTQDDKGRLMWTFFGNSIHDPEEMFWQNFLISPGIWTSGDNISFFTGLLNEVYGEKLTDTGSLYRSGFRILPSGNVSLPPWSGDFLLNNNSDFRGTRYLLTFKPFSLLPDEVRKRYLSGKLNILPFPGSLVFWGMPGYLKLKEQIAEAGQIPLLSLVARNTGIGGMRVSQTGWIVEPHPMNENLNINENLINETYQRTHRWERVHRYQDELNEEGVKIKIIRALFSTDPDALGLYDKPMASNCHLWNSRYELLLNGPVADRKKLERAEKTVSEGGLFGYRFFFPPMHVGYYEIYLHRPLVAWFSPGSNEAVIKSQSLYGYVTGYHRDDKRKNNPVSLWPRMLKRELYISALKDFHSKSDHFSHQTPLNIIMLADTLESLNKKSLPESFAQHLLNIPKHKTFEKWLNSAYSSASDKNTARKMKDAITGMIDYGEYTLSPASLTYNETASRRFEEAWWNDIRFLAHGSFICKENADIVHNDSTLLKINRKHRDLDLLGDYLITRHRKSINLAKMDGKAFAGELPFRWETLFNFSQYGGWNDNQKGSVHERNILVVIPGKDRSKAVVLGDHYDTAYMEDAYEKEKGGSKEYLSANGADDNYSATSTLLQAAPVFLKLAASGKLETDIWLIHLTGEEFPADCMGSRDFCQRVIENKIIMETETGPIDLSGTEITGVFIMDMIGHNRHSDQDVFQISPGRSMGSLQLAQQAHMANMIWNKGTEVWNKEPDRIKAGRGKRISNLQEIPEIARHLPLRGEVRVHYNPHSSIYNTDAQIFSDSGIPAVLFMENYDINRSGYHDSKDTLENIDLDYGSALAAIAIETVARIAQISDLFKS